MDVYLASGNEHKFEEFLELIFKQRLKINFRSAGDVGGMPDVDESGETLEENARIKAEALLEKVPDGAWVLADDSGLLVDALNGAPGVHSARYAGPGGNAMANNLKLLQALKDIPVKERTARFSCVLCLASKGEKAQFFSGTCEGHIVERPSGSRGFGYDPLFCPMGYSKTFADLGSAIKHNLSHRALAVRHWKDWLERLSA